jgi:hypothetical protein
MVKSIFFSGNLSPGNSINVDVDESYCVLRTGVWSMRFDALSITVKTPVFRSHLELSTSVIDSPGYTTLRIQGRPDKRSKVLAPTAVHLFSVNAVRNDRVQLISSGTTQFDHKFTCGGNRITLYFRDVEEQIAGDLGLFVCGILHLQREQNYVD